MSERPRNAVFARVGSRTVPRITRMMCAAANSGFDPVFCGAIRGENLPLVDTWEGWKIVRLGKPYPLLNGRHPLLYLKSVFFYNRDLLRYLRESKAELVHASDFESMHAAIVYRMFWETRLIYNIHDNLAQRYRLPAPVRFLLNQLEGVAVLYSHRTIVPEQFRCDALPKWCRHKVSVVRNMPADPGFAEPLEGSAQKFTIFFGGWLDWGRGLQALIAMAEKNADIELRVAGEGAADIIQALREHPDVTYLGFLEHEDLLDEMKSCHFVAALYDPSRQINVFAASNKLVESLAVGRPAILNSEMLIIESIGKGPHLISEPYSEIDKIAPRLRALYQNPDAYMAACKAARQSFEEQFDWEGDARRIDGIVSGLYQ